MPDLIRHPVFPLSDSFKSRSNNQVINIHHDNGSGFSGEFEKSSGLLNIKQIYSRVRRPKDNAAIDRCGRPVHSMTKHIFLTILNNMSQSALAIFDLYFNKVSKKKLIAIFIFLFLFTPKPILAFSSGMALSIPIKDPSAPNGSLVSSGQTGFELSRIEYDPAFYGVVTTTPAVSFENKAIASGAHPVTTTGSVSVRVSTVNGKISVGDNVTTSKTIGVGVRADYEGYVVGTALEDCAETDVTKECLISVSLAPRFAPGSKTGMKSINLFANVRKAASSPFLSPLTSLRYLLAVSTTAIAFGFGLFFFGRSGKTGIEAMGRNPLASRKIGMGMLLNFCLTGVVMGVGLLISYMILVL